MAYSNKFIRSVINFLSVCSENTSVQKESTFYKRIMLEPHNNILKLPLFASYKLIYTRGYALFNENKLSVTIPKVIAPRVNTLYDNFNKLFTEEYDIGLLGSMRDAIYGIVEYNLKGVRYYLNRGFLADDSRVYMYVENTYRRDTDNGAMREYKIEEINIYINTCVFTLKNEMTKFITSRLMPCLCGLEATEKPSTLALGAKYMETFRFYNSSINKGPCRNNIKISYLCNTELNNVLTGVEAPNIKTFNNEEILNNIIKYIEK